ncbi:uncharacterized protein E5676_scaffold710G00080 [Cucumis melo var. makuwa]|uniref:Uncharacterized protein n=2 Tax=Cucumis melo TaxID=3656 RepID=A0A5D3DEB1_CUCMM|nr:uncharacterized protein E6C27_scaffold352G00100 [Cucumis melo var. makuwa]TYK21936.1 uncharacterized protein E5676_scaffold710G00080 [Cucumis melo var. makuwa]
MASSSWLYIGLGIVLGFLFLGILTELYYLLCRKNKRINDTSEVEEDNHHHFTKQPSRRLIPTETQNPPENRRGFDAELGSGEVSLLKTTGREEEDEDEETEDDLELQGIYNLAGQPRFLFTINEETKEDLESEDGKSRKGSRNRSLSDIIAAIETPFFTPMASPPLKASSPLSLNLESYNYKVHGFNPLFESSEELEQNLKRLRSSPPPKFKFLRDAEEKLYRRLMEEAQRKTEIPKNEQRKVINNNNNNNNQRFIYSSSSSQVLPLISSPPWGFS